MSSLFSSPSKQASSAASAQGQISQQMIDQIEKYTTQQQEALRNAITGQGANPYFGASQQINPSMYAINPNDTVSFGSQGPGTYTVPASQPTTPPQIQRPTNPNPKPPQQTPGPLPINPAQPIQRPPVNNPLPNPVGIPKPGPPSAGPYPKESPRTNPVLGNEPRGIGRITL